MTNRVGQQLGNYQLISHLGEGGFAEVYLGEHVHLGTQAAIKVLHTQLARDDMEQFRTEARTIAHLEHPHIVRILDFGVEDKTPFLVMSYAPNGTLRERHSRGERVPLTTIVSYVKQIADALQYAHDEKLIHRDVKPGNMLLGRRNEILLSDFGIATVAQSSRYQSTQDVVGTVAYMAPEQIQGKPRPTSDQYSLGIVVYEWLSGSRPFHGSFTELCTQHMFAPLPSLHEKNLGIPSEVEQVVQIALAKDPHQRFGSVQAFANALDHAYQPEQSITLHSPPPPAPKPTPPLPATQPVVATPLLWPGEPAVKPTPSPAILSTYQGHSSVVYVVAWSPDGKQLASAGNDRTVQIWNSTTGKRIVTYRGYSDSISALAWSPDGSRIAFSPGKIVQVWDTANHKLVVTYHGYSDSISALTWSPDGSCIAFSPGKTVQIWQAT